MTSSYAKKTKTTKLKGCEMNQLEMTVDESLQAKHWRPSNLIDKM
jgi:hypothetical protein